MQERNLPAAKMRILAASGTSPLPPPRSDHIHLLPIISSLIHPKHPNPTATLPNATDLGAWLGCPPEAVFIFDYTYRPVPLDVHVLGYASSANPFLFNRHLEERVSEQ